MFATTVWPLLPKLPMYFQLPDQGSPYGIKCSNAVRKQIFSIANANVQSFPCMENIRYISLKKGH